MAATATKGVVEESQDQKEELPIPQPPTHLYGYLGNLPDLDPAFALRSIWRLADLYGPIFKLDLVKRQSVVLSNYELIKEVLSDDRFEKNVTGALQELRPLIKDALFSAYPHEPNWHKAHRTLMPVFGPLGVRKMFPEQLDIASQMILRWDRLGPDNIIDTADDFTRLAFDTIGICAFNYRFNNFYAEHMHKFATQMSESLLEAGKRAGRTGIENNLRIWSAQHLQENIDAMHKLCDDLVAERMANPRPEINDLLNTMLNVADPVTGEKLDVENIRNQMVTFLIAGHETTSGTLAYLFYNLLKNPETLQKAQQEVDQVVGDGPIEVKHMSQLKYVDAAIKETLRMNGPIPAVQRRAKQETLLGGKYKVTPDMGIMINLKGLHNDPTVWGDDAGIFRPERMYDGFPTDAWRPFGVGMRSCIGRAFAEQEMILNVALILQRFQVEMADPSYELAIKSTLTTKPDGFSIKVRRRTGKDAMVGLTGAKTTAASKSSSAAKIEGNSRTRSKMTVLYGSNAGTCKAFAEDLQTNAPEFGFEADIKPLDQATENLPTDQPVVIITASYEGKPPDNAKKFVAWLEANASDISLAKGVKYATFGQLISTHIASFARTNGILGVGNSEWAQTYHKVPKLIDNLLTAGGASPICKPAFADVKQDCTGEWEEFSEHFWQTMQETGQAGSHEQKSELRAQVTKHDMPALLGGQEMSYGIIKSCRSLGGQGVGPEKRELEVALPEGTTYSTGDYLVVQPLNNPDTVRRVLARFDLHSDDLISISGTRKAYLQPSAGRSSIEAAVFFFQRVELSGPATVRQLEGLQNYAASEADKARLQELAQDHPKQVLGKNYSLLEILEDISSLQPPLSVFIDSLKPLTPRQYSISSSPLHSANHKPSAKPEGGHDTYSATISYDVHSAPARSGGSRIFNGVCSSFMANLKPGNKIHCFVRRTNADFRLPKDPKTPIIMIAAGTGLAPMRGFVQERTALAEAQGAQALGPAVLYFGCRDFEKDYIYREELAQAETLGAVSMRPTFSKRAPEGEGPQYAYTHERIWAERKEVVGLFKDQGAKIFLCGSASKLAKSTADVLVRIMMEDTGKSKEEALEWLERIREGRYVTDVFD
ncbi:hypothetical protein FH972_025708 [Carpinus fangiana]|uniref:NADPH--cytochrome P450 reductase n=1 Tax=Carpinus fangiana TaxID=176857 RepID=A0A5N6L1T4_9ROSI|nr:hypothetical protein FH972_025708 [Carpinus fangiana]